MKIVNPEPLYIYFNNFFNETKLLFYVFNEYLSKFTFKIENAFWNFSKSKYLKVSMLEYSFEL